MTDMTTWGAAIPVGMKRPEWLRNEHFIAILVGGVLSVEPESSCAFVYTAALDAMYNWCETEFIRLPVEHPYYIATERGFTYWPGGDEAPADWDGGSVLLRSGNNRGIGGCWSHDDSVQDYYTQIIGYQRKVDFAQGAADEMARRSSASDFAPAYVDIPPPTPETPQWALTRAATLLRGNTGAIPNHCVRVFATYIAQHEKPPVDPDVLAVREIISEFGSWSDPSEDWAAPDIKTGGWDDSSRFADALAVYRKHKGGAS